MSTYTEYQARQQKAAKLQELAQTHTCTCGGELNVAYRDDDWHLRCGRCNQFVGEDELVKLRSLTKQYKDGEILNPAIANRIEKTLGGKYMQSTELMKMTQTAMVERAKKGKFPQDMTARDYEVLADIAVTYGLDPLMQELTVYYGNVYVEIAGRRRKAQETQELAGSTVRPMTKEEREERRLLDGDFGSRAIVKRLLLGGFVAEHEGWAVIRNEEIQRNINNARSHNKDPYFIPIVKEPQVHCDKRAEAAALKKGFSIPLPSAEDIGLEEPAFKVTVIPPTQLSEATEDSLKAWAGTSKPKQAAPDREKTGMKPQNGTVTPPEAGMAPISGTPTDVNGLFAEAWKQRKLSRKQLLILAKVKDDGDIKPEMIVGIWARVIEQPMQMVQEGKS